MGLVLNPIARLMPRLLAAAALLVLSQHSAVADAIYDVTINSSSLAGTGATLAFDFISGGGSETNSVTIAGFSSDASLGMSGPNSGSVSGALPGTVTLSDASFFNEELQGLTLGNVIKFTLDATSSAPSAGSLPDTFSFFILDPTASYSLLATSDPTGSDSLFTLQVDGSVGGILDSYSPIATVVPAQVSVPEPASLGMMVLGVVAVVLFARVVRPAPTA